MHCPAYFLDHLIQDPIKIIASFGNLKDSIVSAAYGDLRVNVESNNPRDYCMSDYFSTPSRFAFATIRLGLHFLDAKENDSSLVGL